MGWAASRSIVATAKLAVGISVLGLLGGCFSYLAQGLPEGPYVEPGPAVSGINGKIAVVGGAMNDHGTGFAAASVTAPVPGFDAAGVQLDAIGGAVGDNAVWGVGGHLFLRDPTIGLVGATTRYTERGGFGVGHAGAEIESYIGQITLLAETGYRYGDIREEGIYGSIEGRFYVTDDWYLGAGGEFGENQEMARFQTEFQPDLSRFAAAPTRLNGLSVFIDGAVGKNDTYSVLSGLRFHIGENKTLIRRHREDDPDNQNPQDLGVIDSEPDVGCTPAPMGMTMTMLEYDEPYVMMPVDPCNPMPMREYPPD